MLGKSLRKRVLMALIFLSLVPLAAVAYQGYHCGRMAVSDLMRQHVISVVQARHAMISSWLDERVRDITTRVEQPVFLRQLKRFQADPDPAARAVLEGVIESVQPAGAPFERVTLFDAGWEPIVTSAHGGHAGREIATASFRERVESADGVYFDSAHLHERREAGLHIGRAIRDDSGAITGYLSANLNLTRSLTPLLQNRSGLWNTGKSYLMDGRGQIITEPFGDGSEFAFSARGNPVQLENRNAQEQAVRTYQDFLSQEVIGATVAVPIHDWTLAVEINAEEATEWVQILLFRVTVMVTIALCAVVVVSAWTSRQLGRPLARLARVAHRISEGHTEERVGPMHVEEAEEVRRAVNQMLDELQDKEAELVRTATLATVGELTSSVVHEMRNPLSSIKMNLQSLLHTGTGDGQNRELAQIAFDQVWRLESMLNELLQYGRPLVLAREAVELEDLVESAIASVESKSRECGVAVSAAIDLAQANAYVDVEQFRRALVNLIQNAIEVSPRGGRVEVRVEAAAAHMNGACIRVLDEGPGFRPGQLDKLFKPFFTTKRDGIGLGLANVKKIVSMHGGTVEAGNREEAGAAFRVEIPLAVES